MTHRTLPAPLTAYRIGDPNGAYPIYSGDGARRVAGRWHRAGQPVIYASLHYSTSMLERLVHYSGAMPVGQHFLTIEIPAGVAYEVATVHTVPGWESRDQRAARSFGSQWIDERRSAVLLVPSVVARMEQNVLINPAHPQSARIVPGLEQPIWWDERLFAKPL
ncbi:MAG: RES domain-containing protein [Hyphomicrobiaceae bacterium]|nr:RES domain-containing protein [Hyphomicrobiaceae bacterium]